MLENKKHEYIYPATILGAGLMILLRICDKANALSLVLVILGITSMLYSVQHACLKREYIFIAGIMALTFAVRCYGYTGDAVVDLILGFVVGLIMFALMRVEGLVKKFEDSILYTLIYPASYILFMYFTEIIKINMPFRMDTYLSCIPVLCQITSLLGIYVLDFLLAWTASVIVFCIDHRESRQGIALGFIYAGVLCGVISFGIVHINHMNAREAAKTDTIRLACVAGPYIGTLSDSSYTELTIEEILESLNGIVQEAAEENVEILVFSEESYDVTDQKEEILLEEAEKLASEHDIHLLLAYEVTDTDDSEDGKGINKLCWISNEGQVIYDYTKHCIIPFIETTEYVRGDKNIEAFDVEVHGKNLKVATAICYDADFDSYMSHMGKNVDLLLLPTWDWDVIAEEHFSVARLRAIQTETSLVRSVYDGWSAVIDSAGNVLARENTNEIGYEKTYVYDVPVR